MDALRKAEEEKKKAAQARTAVPPQIPETAEETSTELVLEPLGAALTEDLLDEHGRDALSVAAGADRVSNRPPSMVQTALQEYFESAPPAPERPRSGRDTWPGVGSNENTSSTLERAAVVGARTVFEAGRNPTGNYLFRIGLGGVFALLVVLSGAAYYHYLLTPKVNPMPLPTAAVTVTQPMPETTKPSARPTVVAIPTAESPEGVETPGEDSARTPVVPTTATAPQHLAQPRADQAPTVGATAFERTSAAIGGAEPEVEVAPGLLRISRRGAAVTLDTNLLDGYAALQREDWNAADAAYRKALRNNPASRDAMLGLAAVALRSGDAEQARSWYRELLQRDPNDSVAMAALFAEDGGEALDESRLRQLLEQQPDAAHIRFALGRAYARQQRWPDAQQQFFDAFGAAPDNADYAFNLAVSLDHLGQSAAAAGYYRKALDLVAAGAGASFDRAAARARMAALGAR